MEHDRNKLSGIWVLGPGRLTRQRVEAASDCCERSGSGGGRAREVADRVRDHGVDRGQHLIGDVLGRPQ
jgi:hypothetical protein